MFKGFKSLSYINGAIYTLSYIRNVHDKRFKSLLHINGPICILSYIKNVHDILWVQVSMLHHFKVDVVIKSNIQGFRPHHTNKKLEVMTDFNLVTTIIIKQEKEKTFMNSH